ncbi:hypothetical protein PTSG_06119 [Salpingoeca rosetta]|uniref:Ubiquitin-activating enzyme SCCH domain-containing protein n=1 Tax=Salpingoeca rosetta (strain ATCC 50818 / BSB-021) TaxID=946362 RepID=F2UC02_SALR5|nr:uncharacterized protein PTSG_06119 [Salpingoeca rosetta]EGD74109.1 hypothetical protein PTSG_06119 [Salpingoeca rosetta]|eukprot:XP_004993010.1 hypothetical protein PTSG_06119 [Salpingoeca rosetta]
MGTGTNVDVIVPHTEIQPDSGDAEAGGGIPMCTLRNFPHLIDHCIEWARAKVTDLFVSPASQLQQFLEDPEGFTSGLETKFEQHERIGALERGVDTLKAIKDLAAQLQEKPTMETCVSLAWRDFHAFSRDVILDLIATFPAGAKTKSGEPFWSGARARACHKIFPEVLEFDPQNPLHKEFLIAAANLYACVFKVHPTKYPSEENKLHMKRPPGSCPSASSEQGGYSYVNASPDGRLLVAELFVWDMHRLTCKQRVPVTATDMVWTKDGKHLIGPSYSRVYICGLGVREAERTVIYEKPFPGAELACAAASDGVIERWQKLGQPSTLLAEWRADAVDNGEETIQDVGGEEARGEVESEPAMLADSSNKLASACGNTVHVCAIDHHQHDQQDHQQQQQQQERQHKLKVSRNAPVKFGIFARHSSVLLVNSVESLIKCDYSTPPYCIAMTEQMTWSQQFDLCHLRPTTDPRCRSYAIVPVVVPPATPPADAHKLDDYDVTALPYLTSSAKHLDMAKKMMEAAVLSSFVLDCPIHLA